MSIQNVQLLKLPKMADSRGNLTFLEVGQLIPFELKRLYYIYDVPEGARRGGHAHWQCEKLLIALVGSVEVIVDDGLASRSWPLQDPVHGLYVPRGIWQEVRCFSPGAVCLVLASTLYNAMDYQRDYQAYRQSAAALG